MRSCRWRGFDGCVSDLEVLERNFDYAMSLPRACSSLPAVVALSLLIELPFRSTPSLSPAPACHARCDQSGCFYLLGRCLLCSEMLRQAFRNLGQPHLAPRSFFGVEDYLDDNNSRPYTYQKGKKSKNPNKHVSFKQRTIAYMEPFTLDVFISKRFVSASLTHRVTCKQVAVAGTNSKDIKAVLKSRSDIPACLAVGQILADRAREADVYTASYTPRERDKFEGKIRAVVQSLIDSGIDIKVYLD
ncbi:hypothetical protein NL676_030643 [Syzygium grande]|nr:hypothetical protein NL676_030643 [Syzygium grande]